MITAVVLPVQLYHLTRSTVMVGLIGVAEFIPMFSLALVGGALSDAFDRRWLVRLAEAGAALVSLLLVANASLHRPLVWVLYVCAALAAAAGAILGPPLGALLPRLVEPDELTAAFAIDSGLGNLASVAGPALGGVLIAAFGAMSAYTVDVATYLFSLAALTLMSSVPPPADGERPSLRSIAAGLRYAGSRRELVGSYVVDLVAMIFGMPNALFPAFARRIGGGAVVGLLYAAPSAGAVLAALVSGWAGRYSRHGLAIVLAACGWGLAIAAFGLTRSLWLALGLLALAGGADSISALFRAILWNGTIPDELRGRLQGVALLSYTSGPVLGNAEAGLAAGAIGVTGSIVAGGLLCVVGAAFTALALPEFWHYRGPDLALKPGMTEPEAATL